MRDVGVGGVLQHCGIEMPEVAINELADTAHLHFTNFSQAVLVDLMQNFWHDSQALIAFFCRNFSRYRGEDLRCQNVWHHTKQKNCGGEHGDCGLLENLISDQ